MAAPVHVPPKVANVASILANERPIMPNAVDTILSEAPPIVRCSVDWRPYHALQQQLDDKYSDAEERIADVRVAGVHPRVRALLAREGRIMQHTPAWYEGRKKMLTASTAGAVLGTDPYTTPRQLLMKKTGQHVDEERSGDSLAAAHGTRTENEAREWVCHVTGLALLRDDHDAAVDVGLVVHPQHDWIGASPDGVFKCGLLVEIKCPRSRAIRHTVPLHYYAQVQMQLEVCDLEECVFAQYKRSTAFARGELDIILVRRDREWWARMFRLHFQPFWNDVLEGLAERARERAEQRAAEQEAQKKRKLGE